MLLRLALTIMLQLDAFDVVTYADVNDAYAGAEMWNAARHLVGPYDVLLFPHMLLSQLLRDGACDDVMLNCVYICVRVCLAFA